MFKGCAAFFLFFVLLLQSVSQIKAIIDPREFPNNHFGIHILQESDLEDAAELVNSNGGEWGYVTVLIQDDDLDQAKWQRIFDKMRELKLIPLVRIATHPQDQYWVKPKEEDAEKWADFLSSLNWVVKNRYVILFNEPNHNHEWEDKINPQEYTRIAKNFKEALKSNSEDFFILPAGFDVAAPNSKTTMDATLFWQRMYKEDNDIFKIFDGWSSHSYPNPAFSAHPEENGRLSIKSYDWEMSYLKNYGLDSDLPIFITETGWVHREGKVQKVLGRTSDDIGNFFEYAYKDVWSDKKIVAVTPFVLNYQNQPFDHFSWKKTDTEFYSQFHAVQTLEKPKGSPTQEEDNLILNSYFSPFIFSGVPIPFSITFKNTGQSIWDGDEGYSITTYDTDQVKLKPLTKTKPGENLIVSGVIKTIPGERVTTLKVSITHNGTPIGQIFKNDLYSLMTYSSTKLIQTSKCLIATC
jgi:hypothetical protein